MTTPLQTLSESAEKSSRQQEERGITFLAFGLFSVQSCLLKKKTGDGFFEQSVASSSITIRYVYRLRSTVHSNDTRQNSSGTSLVSLLMINKIYRLAPTDDGQYPCY